MDYFTLFWFCTGTRFALFVAFVCIASGRQWFLTLAWILSLNWKYIFLRSMDSWRPRVRFFTWSNHYSIASFIVILNGHLLVICFFICKINLRREPHSSFILLAFLVIVAIKFSNGTLGRWYVFFFGNDSSFFFYRRGSFWMFFIWLERSFCNWLWSCICQIFSLKISLLHIPTTFQHRCSLTKHRL